MRPLRLLAALLAPLALVACGGKAPASPTVWVTVAWPAGASEETVVLVPSRGGRVVWGWQTTWSNPGLASLRVPGRAPFDLQASVVSPGGHALGADRHLHAVAGHAGHLRGVLPGARDLVLRLRAVETQDVVVEVEDDGGRPVAGARVLLRFLADWIEGVTDAEGRAWLGDVPVRTWRVVVTPPGERGLGASEARLSAGEDAVLVRLSPARR